MSLIGSLKELCLGDILQILRLSQKSGMLVLRTDDGEGRIVFRAGLVSGASNKVRTPRLARRAGGRRLRARRRFRGCRETGAGK